MTKDTEALREALERIANYSGGTQYSTIAGMRGIAKDALATPASDVLPCDVKLPPATTIRAGCSFDTLRLAITAPDRPRHFASGAIPTRQHLNETILQGPASDVAPVAYEYTDPDGSERIVRCTRSEPGEYPYWTETPLYAHPPHPAPVDPVAGGEAIIATIERELATSEMLDASPSRLRRIKAERIARALAALQGPAA